VGETVAGVPGEARRHGRVFAAVSGTGTVMSGAVALGGARIGAKSLGFATAVLVARHLGRNLYGQYSLITSVALIFSYLADFGLVSCMIREVAGEPDDLDSLVSLGLTAQLVVSVVCAGALGATDLVLATSPLVRIGIAIAAVGLFVESLSRPLSGVIIGRNRLILSALLIAGTSFLNSVLLLMALVAGAGTLWLVAVSIPVAGATSLALAAIVLPSIRFRLDSNARQVLTLLRRSLPFAVLAGSAVVYDRLDVVLVAKISGSSAVGIYAAAGRVTEGLLVIPAAIGAALYPTLAADGLRAVANLRATLRWAVPLCAVVTLLAVVPGGMFVDLIFGGRYPGVGVTFQLLVPTVALQSLTIPLAYMLQAGARTTLAVMATVVGLAVDILCNVVLVPRFDARGASVSATIAEGCVLAVLVWFVMRNRPPFSTVAG
jgi:PST family polysaccharide transporter